MDLDFIETSKFADQGSTMTLLGLDDKVFCCDDGTPMTITVNGTDGEKLRSYARSKADLKSKRRIVTQAEEEADRIEFIVVATIDWHLQMGGKMLPCTPENARDIYKRFPRIRAQVEAFMMTDANFGKALSTT